MVLRRAPTVLCGLETALAMLPARPPRSGPRPTLRSGRALQSKHFYGQCDQAGNRSMDELRRRDAVVKHRGEATAEPCRPLGERKPDSIPHTKSSDLKLEKHANSHDRPLSARVQTKDFCGMTPLNIAVAPLREREQHGFCRSSSDGAQEMRSSKRPPMISKENNGQPSERFRDHSVPRRAPLETKGQHNSVPADDWTPTPPPVNAKAFAVVDGDTGEFLGGAGYSIRRPVASLTKIMTCLIVVDLASRQESILKEELTVSEAASKIIGTSARLRHGDRLSIRNALLAMMLPSGNDAAFAIAEHFGKRLYARRLAASRRARLGFQRCGVREPKEDVLAMLVPSEREAADILGEVKQRNVPDAVTAWVSEMNNYTTKLGLHSTRYENPHGMSQRWHLSTAEDSAALTVIALKMSLFREIVGTIETTVCVRNSQSSDELLREMTWRNTNALMEEGYFGVKTGTTPQAGFCLASAKKVTSPGESSSSRTLVTIVLACKTKENRYQDTRDLMDWGQRLQMRNVAKQNINKRYSWNHASPNPRWIR
jgi:D-alanyl-D-alanine carboxypeptidase (penicillin-binding protein 5/6)